MKILVTHSSNFDFREKIYIPLRNSPLSEKFEFFLPQEDNREKLTKNIIKSCSLVIAECSLPSTGQGIELGWANAYNIPVICIHEKDSKVSPSLQYITDNFIEYSDSKEMLESLEHSLKFLSKK